MRSRIAAAAPMPVRRRRNGEKRAKPNHASSQRKMMSGLIARHSSIVRFTFATWPSNVQLVRTTSFARSSFPSAFSWRRAFLIGLMARLPYIEYWVSGNASM
jgi:hypothetical protein